MRGVLHDPVGQPECLLFTDGGKGSCWKPNELRADFSHTLQAEADRVEPAHYGKCGDALDEGVVEGEQDVFADSEGTAFPKEIQPLVTFSDDLLVRRKFK